MIETMERPALLPLCLPAQAERPAPRKGLLTQLSRFGLVGALNTAIDLLVLNGLLALFPTTSTPAILLYTALAFSVGAVNSFLLNKHWTFERQHNTTLAEVARFATATAFGIAGNMLFIALASVVPHPFLSNAVAWTNLSKVFALGSTSLLSFLGMRLWVFVHQ
jgi:putative flippase GtrA